MARTPTPTRLHSSPLLQMLTDMAGMAPDAGGAAFAEQLSQWVGFTQAISLAGVHSASNTPSNTSSAAPTGRTPAADNAPAALAEAVAHTRARLERAIRQAALPEPDLHALAPEADGTLAHLSAAFEPYRRHYLAQQRELEAGVGPLRTRMRRALAQATPALRQLAVLDGAFDSILAEREARLLYTLPRLLRGRFDTLARTPPPSSDGAAHQRAWLARFGDELRHVLLAELDLRLQPTLGLLGALQPEPSHPL